MDARRKPPPAEPPAPPDEPLTPRAMWRKVAVAVDFLNCNALEWDRAGVRLRLLWVKKAVAELAPVLAELERQVDAGDKATAEVIAEVEGGFVPGAIKNGTRRKRK